MKKELKFITIKNVILFIILLILVGLVAYNKSFAFEYANLGNLMNWGKVGDILSIGYSNGSAQLAAYDDDNKDNLYCVQYGANIGDAVPYGVIYKIRIEGSHAISSHVENGQNLTSDSPANAKLAYILGGGNYTYGYGREESKTDRQFVVWNYWNTWVNESGSKLGVNWTWSKNGSTNKSTNLLNEANQYAQKSSVAQISSNVGDAIDTDNQKAGAFNVSYTGNISSVIVKDINGNDITDGLSYVQNNKTINPLNIASGQDFYIVNNSGRILKSVKIDVQNNSQTINVDMWLLQSNKSGNQKLMAARPEIATTTKTASVTINMSTSNTFRVVKYGVNGDNEYKQAGVGFVIYRDGSGYLKRNNVEGYIGKEVQIGKMEYNETFFSWTTNKDNATIFETVNSTDGWTGYFQITQIPAGNYYIGEVYNKNQGYESSKIVKSTLEKYKNDNMIDSTTITNVQQNENISGYTKNSLQVINVNIQDDGYTKVLRVYDKKDSDDDNPPPSNTFRVVKYGVNGNNEYKQAGVGFVIYRDGSGYLKRNNVEGYIGKEVQIGKMEYNETFFSWTTNKNDATIFETVNSNDGMTGYFQITKIPAGNYYIGEVYNKNQGFESSKIVKCILEKYKDNKVFDYISITNIQQNENIPGYTKNKLQVINVNIQDDGNAKILRVYDKKDSGKEDDPNYMDIHITKTKTTSNTKLAGAQFKIKVLNQQGKAIGWLRKTSMNEYIYDIQYLNATTWSTSTSSNKKDNYVYAHTKGEIEITGLSTQYQYEIYETQPASGGYALSNQIMANSSGMSVKIDGNKVKNIKYIKASNTSTSSNKYAATNASIYCGTVSYEQYGPSVDVLVTNRTGGGGGGGGRRWRKHTTILIH